MIRIANEIIKSKMTSFLGLPNNNLGAIDGEIKYNHDQDDDTFTYKSYA